MALDSVSLRGEGSLLGSSLRYHADRSWIRVYPWLRNSKYLEGASTECILRRWNWIRESNLDGEKKDFVVHLQYPPAAVEMLQTSWGEIQPRLSGLRCPRSHPDQLQTFLLEAQSFFHEQCEDSSSKASHVFPPLEVVGLKKRFHPNGVMESWFFRVCLLTCRGFR